MPAADVRKVASFYREVPALAHLLRCFTYNSLAPLFFAEAATVPTWVSSVKWDSVKELSEHSDYVNRIVEALKQLSQRLSKLVRAPRDTLAVRTGARASWHRRDVAHCSPPPTADRIGSCSRRSPAPRVRMLRRAPVRALRGGRGPRAQVQHIRAGPDGDGHHLHQPAREPDPEPPVSRAPLATRSCALEPRSWPPAVATRVVCHAVVSCLLTLAVPHERRSGMGFLTTSGGSTSTCKRSTSRQRRTSWTGCCSIARRTRCGTAVVCSCTVWVPS